MCPLPVQLDVLYLYRLVDTSTSQQRQEIYRMCTTHIRAHAVPTEQRVRCFVTLCWSVCRHVWLGVAVCLLSHPHPTTLFVHQTFGQIRRR